jgi:hypothetical protein
MSREKRLITFWCELGGHEVTELAGSGQVPRCCAEHKAEAKAHMAKMRMRAMRERKGEKRRSS